TTLELYAKLRERLEEIEREHPGAPERLYYLATPPSLYDGIVVTLGKAGLAEPRPGGWTRIIIEKPFGHDLASAQELNRLVTSVFREEQVYRIDHYLGKETVQNVLALRFANGIFEPLWNRNHVAEVQFTVAETVGVEGRGGYYEESGALRAQYGPGFVDGRPVPGYRQEKGVKPDSTTETYAALRLLIDNWRWAGVPFYLQTGKRLGKRMSEIVIRFHRTPHLIFRRGDV